MVRSPTRCLAFARFRGRQEDPVALGLSQNFLYHSIYDMNSFRIEFVLTGVAEQ